MTNNASITDCRTFDCGTITDETWGYGHPLSIDGCVIMMCESGKATLSINSRRFTMAPGMTAFVLFDMVVIPVEVSTDFSARFFSMSFEKTQDISFLVPSNRFWDFIYKSPVFPVPTDIISTMSHWFSLLYWAHTNNSGTVKDAVMRNEAENFMLVMYEQIETRLGALKINPSKNRAWTIANDFGALLSRHYATHHNVAFYADRLHVTPNYLNIIMKRCSGISAKEQINTQIVLVIKTLLDTTDISVKQIADRLHYEDPSYLCRIFRKQTGMSPIQYRNKLHLAKGGTTIT